jgi:hypothetical protein
MLVSGVVEDAGGATNLPVSAAYLCMQRMPLLCPFQTAVEPGQNMVEVMIPASKVGLVIGA